MPLEQAQAMAESLMRYHGVYDYRFSYMKRRSNFGRAGQCNYRTCTIQLAPVFVEKNLPVVVKWTILHEIAHAIMGAKHGHNKYWKACAKMLGDDGERCYGSYVKH